MLITTQELKSILKRASSAKSENLILSNGGIVAQDSDVTICVACDGFNGFDKPVSVNNRKFTSVVNRMTGPVELIVSQNIITLKSAKCKIEMELFHPKSQVFTKPEGLITLPLSPIREILKYVSMAADTNKAAFMGGVVQIESVTSGLFEEEKITGIEAMGTDGKRCAYTNIPLEDIETPFKYLMTLPAVAALQSLDGDTIQVGETASYYYLSTKQTTVYANRLAKASPNYRSLLPKDFKFQATVDAAEFKQVLHVVEPMIQDVEQFAVFVHFLDGKLSVQTVGKGGTASDEMEYVADPLADVSEFKTKLNHKLLSDYFSVVSGEVTFNANPPVLNKGQMIPQPVILESGNRKIMIAPVAGGSE